MFLKRSWIIEETVCQTHKQYNAYEVWKLFGVEVRSALLYENGKKCSHTVHSCPLKQHTVPSENVRGFL